MAFASVLERIIAGEDLDRESARSVMGSVMAGELDGAQIGGLLIALRMKGAVPQELAGFVDAMRGHALTVPHTYDDLVDTCGTGGGRTTFNLSTAAAIVAAAAGARIAKHGNRGVTSKCGSADVLEAAGVTLNSDPERLAHLLERLGIVFLFAPHHHPAMRHVGPARKALGVRTVFNQLGPLLNPAGARRQLIGVYSTDLLMPMAEALSMLGVHEAYVVHSADGLDEVSPCAPTQYVHVFGGATRDGHWQPSDFGQEPLHEDALIPGGTPQEGAEIMREALSEIQSPRARAVVPNAAVTLRLAGIAMDLKEGAEMARRTIRDGSAAALLQALVEATRGE